MKKMIAIMLAAALLTGVFAVPCFAAQCDERVKVLMSDPEVIIEKVTPVIQPEELKDAIENGSELVPEGCKLSAKRISVIHTGTLSSDEEYYYATFKVWSTLKRTIALFFKPDSTAEWELVSCNLGDVIEGRFEDCGTFAITVSW